MVNFLEDNYVIFQPLVIPSHSYGKDSFWWALRELFPARASTSCLLSLILLAKQRILAPLPPLFLHSTFYLFTNPFYVRYWSALYLYRPLESIFTSYRAFMKILYMIGNQLQLMTAVMPDFAQVYSFIGSVFDPNATGHLQRLKQMDPINLETVCSFNSGCFIFQI